MHNMVLQNLELGLLTKEITLAFVVYELSIQSEFSFHPMKSST